MRADVRRKHKDIRANSTVMRTLWNFVTNLESYENEMMDAGSRDSKKKKRKPSEEDEYEELEVDNRLITLNTTNTTNGSNPPRAKQKQRTT